MSIFGSILSKITGRAQATESGSAPGQTASTGSGAPDDAASGSTGPIQEVDVAAILNGLAAKAPQRLDWQHSIVDLMKLLDLDSSLTARKELAQELHYQGSTSDSAAMNIWLHRQVMQKLAENGGRVPEDLRHQS